jgi:hypothetical protein
MQLVTGVRITNKKLTVLCLCRFSVKSGTVNSKLIFALAGDLMYKAVPKIIFEITMQNQSRIRPISSILEDRLARHYFCVYMLCGALSFLFLAIFS